MDSTLILQWAESLSKSRGLIPVDSAELLRDLRWTGLALAACDKTVQLVYERQLRPAEKQHQPWLDRVDRQLDAAYAALEREVSSRSQAVDFKPLTHGQIATAVAWSFTQLMLPERVLASAHPALVQFAAAAEQLAAFRACPQVGAAS